MSYFIKILRFLFSDCDVELSFMESITNHKLLWINIWYALFNLRLLWYWWCKLLKNEDWRKTFTTIMLNFSKKFSVSGLLKYFIERNNSFILKLLIFESDVDHVWHDPYIVFIWPLIWPIRWPLQELDWEILKGQVQSNLSGS